MNGGVMRLRYCVLLFAFGCATAGGPRHVTTIAVVSAHSTLALIQDTELLMVCGRTMAPPPPSCIPLDRHHDISHRLMQAFDFDSQIGHIVRDLPVGAPQPAKVITLLAEIADLVDGIVNAIPPSPQKMSLVQQIAPPTPVPTQGVK